MSKPAESITGEHRTFASLAERAVREMVLDGRLAPGVRINEVQLAAQLQISRGPLREAVQRLANQGLLTIKSHRGAFVCVVDLEELHHLYELRIALESFAVRTIVTRADAGQMNKLSVLLAKARLVLDQDGDARDELVSRSYPSELDFHRQVALSCGNPALVEVHERTLQQIGLARSRSAHDPERARRALDEHELVLRAILAGDETLAMQSLEEHLWSSLRSAEETMAQMDQVRDSAANE